MTEEQEAFIAAQVKDGRYPDVESALRDGVFALELIDSDEEMQLRRLHAEIKIGLDQLDRGEYVEVRLDQLGDYLNSLGRTATKKWPPA
ncbi:hypothetical protein HHL28_03050 [Aerophototrophica crusticola]|uniref:CopG family transcriptional regulator n=1 Tax=Aerophototrophica crusticola TaxID=1709002 RepID=A0A858R4A0_9PROT|nr:hypothetical protein HHL28_03050 [Rhodospirillaceae bacterium B3]